eukprot:GGOE01061783.1.p2 GENE.GGOE01061783.1~~GGOE01061783.1.p2  ORF type:complete len:387 (-),score=126.61 GGOE01061783.1:248-1408(-)
MTDSALYSDLPAAKDEEGGPKAEARWVGPSTLMPTVARKRDAPADAAAAPVAKKRAKPAPLVAYESADGSDMADPEATGDSAEAAAEDNNPTNLPFSTLATTPPAAKPSAATAEYNPLQPNDYEDCLKERRLKLTQRRKEEEMERRRREMQKFDEREGLTPLELTGDDAWKRRAILSGRSPDEIPDADPDPDATEEKKLTPAERMMMAMGWKGEGSGLGKNQDGIATPLMHRKTSQSAGQIVQAPPKQAAPPKKAAPTMVPPTKKPTKRLRGRPSEVIMLRNMVGPGEVDEDLCKETEEECQEKYGGVQECKVHEVKDEEVTPQEAVRIFVRFTSIENAVKAAVDLDGRFFAGRTVCACFFDARRYENDDLAPGPNEPEIPPEILS